MIRGLCRRAACAAVTHAARTSVYWDARDWWVGLFRDTDDRTWYVCPVPCLVVRYKWPQPSGVLYATHPALEQLAALMQRLGDQRGVPLGPVNPPATGPGHTDGSST